MISQLVLLLVSIVLSCALQPAEIPRRQIIQRGILDSSVSLILSQSTQPASAVRGAAELDLEFYLRDLVGGNKKEGNINRSAPPDAPPPRTIQGPLLPLLLNKECNPSCIPVQMLVNQIKSKRQDDVSIDTIVSQIQTKVNKYRNGASKAFAAKAPWLVDDVCDQYYFDLTAYALWKAAADLIPDYYDRDVFARSVGKAIYETLQSQKLITPPNAENQSPDKLVQTISTIIQIMDIFEQSQYIKNYRIGEDETVGKKPTSSNNNKMKNNNADSKNNNTQQYKPPIVVFDELDDETLAIGGTVDCLVSILEPATLTASLQITGEQSRFGPDFVGSTLAALWESIGVRTSWETYFIDSEYRPNPKDYFPNEQLFQFSLKNSRKKKITQ